MWLLANVLLILIANFNHSVRCSYSDMVYSLEWTGRKSSLFSAFSPNPLKSPFSIRVSEVRRKRIGSTVFAVFVEEDHSRYGGVRLASASYKPGLTLHHPPPLPTCTGTEGLWECQDMISVFLLSKQHASAPASLPKRWPDSARSPSVQHKNLIFPFVHPCLLPHTEEAKCV